VAPAARLEATRVVRTLAGAVEKATVLAEAEEKEATAVLVALAEEAPGRNARQVVNTATFSGTDELAITVEVTGSAEALKLGAASENELADALTAKAVVVGNALEKLSIGRPVEAEAVGAASNVTVRHVV